MLQVLCSGRGSTKQQMTRLVSGRMFTFNLFVCVCVCRPCVVLLLSCADTQISCSASHAAVRLKCFIALLISQLEETAQGAAGSRCYVQRLLSGQSGTTAKGGQCDWHTQLCGQSMRSQFQLGSNGGVRTVAPIRRCPWRWGRRGQQWAGQTTLIDVEQQQRDWHQLAQLSAFCATVWHRHSEQHAAGLWRTAADDRGKFNDAATVDAGCINVTHMQHNFIRPASLTCQSIWLILWSARCASIETYWLVSLANWKRLNAI